MKQQYNSNVCFLLFHPYHILEIVQPMIQEIQTQFHREISDLRGDIVRQFFEQERIIQEQREQIDMLIQLLQSQHKK